MRLIRLNTRGVRFICFALGLCLAYSGYRQIPLGTEPTLGVVAETMETGWGQIFGTAMLIVGSFLASISTVLEGVYAYQGWGKSKNWVSIVNIAIAALIFILVAYLTWPGFEWALAATAVVAVAVLANKIVRDRKRTN